MMRKRVIAAVLVLIAAPAVFALVRAVSFHIANRNNGSMVSSGEKREYIVYVPRSYHRWKPAPLVISLHGAGGWPAQQMNLSRWNPLAEREGFIVVYPSAAERGGPGIWHLESGALLTKDVRFISDLIQKLEADYNIDRERIYASGLSNGGGMSFALSCTMSDRIAAVGMVAAAQTLPWSWCSDRRAVPMIAFHGTADPVVPYSGGVSWISSEAFPSIPRWTANWARRNRCGQNPRESRVAPDVIRREYTNCADNAAVVLYTIEKGGHSWPSSSGLPDWLVGPTSNSIDATAEMWAFFRAHPLARR